MVHRQVLFWGVTGMKLKYILFVDTASDYTLFIFNVFFKTMFSGPVLFNLSDHTWSSVCIREILSFQTLVYET